MVSGTTLLIDTRNPIPETSNAGGPSRIRADINGGGALGALVADRAELQSISRLTYSISSVKFRHWYPKSDTRIHQKGGPGRIRADTNGRGVLGAPLADRALAHGDLQVLEGGDAHGPAGKGEWDVTTEWDISTQKGTAFCVLAQVLGPGAQGSGFRVQGGGRFRTSVTRSTSGRFWQLLCWHTPFNPPEPYTLNPTPYTLSSSSTSSSSVLSRLE